jgi:hypothetical protein
VAQLVGMMADHFHLLVATPPGNLINPYRISISYTTYIFKKWVRVNPLKLNRTD